MGNLLFIAAVILLVGWLIGYFGYNAGGAFHMLLIIAFIAILISLIGGKKRCSVTGIPNILIKCANL